MLRNVQLKEGAEVLSVGGSREAFDGGRAVMQTMTHTNATRHGEALFSPLPHSTLGGRLARALAGAASEFARAPLAYLRAALLPENIKDWLPLRFARALAMLMAHPWQSLGGTARRDVMLAGFIDPSARSSLGFVTNAISSDEKGARRRDRFMPILAASASVHAVFIGYLVYLTVSNMFAPFMDISFVSKDYNRPTATMVGPLYNPARPQRAAAEGEAMSLEEIRERETKRREEAEQRERERQEREKREREKAEREKAERERAEKERLAQQNAEQAEKGNDAGPSIDELKKVEINEKPLKEIIGNVYGQYKAGGVDLEVMNFTIMASFKIEPDGSLTNRKIIQSSGSKVIDDSGMALLHAISESHALSLFASLSSGTIRFELNQNQARLTVTAFAPSSSEAQKYADALGLLVYISKMKPDLTPETKELLSLLKIKTVDQRINAEMATSRARATEMMHARFDPQAR